MTAPARRRGGLFLGGCDRVVTPFALLSACTGIIASAAILGEAFTQLRYAGMALILAGLPIIMLPSVKSTTPAGPSA